MEIKNLLSVNSKHVQKEKVKDVVDSNEKNEFKKKVEASSEKPHLKQIDKTGEIKNDNEVKEVTIIEKIEGLNEEEKLNSEGREVLKDCTGLAPPGWNSEIPQLAVMPNKKGNEILNISTEELTSLLKEVSNNNSDTNDLIKILKSMNVFQKNGDKMERVEQLNGNPMMEKIEELFNGVKDLDLKELLIELNEVLKNPSSDLLTNLKSVGNVIEKIESLVRTFENAEFEVTQLEQTSDLLNELKKEVNLAGSLEIKTGKIDLLGANDMTEVDESLELGIGSDNRIMDKLVEKGVKYQEMTLDQFKKDVGDKLSQIDKLITMKDKMLVQLNPKNLGNLEIFIQKTGESIEITVEFEKKMAKVHIEAILEEVKKDFKEREIDIQFSFKEREQKDEEKRERKNENKQFEGNLKNENEKPVFEDLIERLLGGNSDGN